MSIKRLEHEVRERAWILRTILFAAWIVSACAMCPDIALAQTADNTPSGAGLEEIVVTATRRAEPLQDIPVSASAFTQEKLDAEGVRNIDELARLTPGVTHRDLPVLKACTCDQFES